MRTIRKSADRGVGGTTWLESRHSFSFANYFDRDHVGFRSLRVINEDWIAPASGFGMHPHRDMEILSYPIAGALEHRDSEGHVSTLRPGRVQLMHAGRGIMHSEMNPSPSDPSHLLQIWIQPASRGVAPGYQEADLDFTKGNSVPVASMGGQRGGLKINQDVTIEAMRLPARESLSRSLDSDRHAWIQIVSGSGRVSDLEVEAGDGVAISDESDFAIESDDGIEVLVFDLA
jgi:redox-sensitive bicupin YhaK (pirin superfamily)